jgi:type III secretion system low calcium response chaperone LcrH/SycD
MNLAKTDPTEEMINEAIEKVMADYSEEQKEKYVEMIKLIYNKDVSLALALKMKPELLEGIYAYAYRLYGSGNFQTALLLFAYLVTLEPAILKYHMGQAACHHMLKQYDEAENSYIIAYYLDRKNPLPFFHIADCKLKTNSIEEAFFCLGVAAELAKQHPKYDKIKEKALLMQNALTVDPSKNLSKAG